MLLCAKVRCYASFIITAQTVHCSTNSVLHCFPCTLKQTEPSISSNGTSNATLGALDVDSNSVTTSTTTITTTSANADGIQLADDTGNAPGGFDQLDTSDQQQVCTNKQ
jgi:hypothetical protein